MIRKAQGRLDNKTLAKTADKTLSKVQENADTLKCSILKDNAQYTERCVATVEKNTTSKCM